MHSCRSRGHSPQPQPVVDNRFFFSEGQIIPCTISIKDHTLYTTRVPYPSSVGGQFPKTYIATLKGRQPRPPSSQRNADHIILPYTPILYIHPKTTSPKSSRTEENVRRLLLHIAIVATDPPRPRPRRPTNGRQRQHPNLTTLLSLPITSIPPFSQHLPLALLPLPPKPTTPNLRPLPLRLRPQTTLHLNPNPKTARTHPHPNTRPPIPTHHPPNRQTHTSLPLPGRGIRPHTPGHRPLRRRRRLSLLALRLLNNKSNFHATRSPFRITGFRSRKTLSQPAVPSIPPRHPRAAPADLQIAMQRVRGRGNAALAAR